MVYKIIKGTVYNKYFLWDTIMESFYGSATHDLLFKPYCFSNLTDATNYIISNNMGDTVVPKLCKKSNYSDGVIFISYKEDKINEQSE